MSSRTVLDHSGYRRTDLHVDHAYDKFTINTVQDAQSIVDENKRRYN